MYRTFYNNTTGKILISRKMSQVMVDARLLEHTDQGVLNVYTTDIDNKRVNLETLEIETITPPNTTFEWMKQRRNMRLLECDWTQGVDSPLSDTKKAEWQTYRQALRDLPETYPNPTSKDQIIWPTQPE